MTTRAPLNFHPLSVHSCSVFLTLQTKQLLLLLLTLLSVKTNPKQYQTNQRNHSLIVAIIIHRPTWIRPSLNHPTFRELFEVIRGLQKKT